MAVSEDVNNASFLLKVQYYNSRSQILGGNVAMAICLTFSMFYRGNRHDEASRPHRCACFPE